MRRDASVEQAEQRLGRLLRRRPGILDGRRARLDLRHLALDAGPRLTGPTPAGVLLTPPGPGPVLLPSGVRPHGRTSSCSGEVSGSWGGPPRAAERGPAYRPVRHIAVDHFGTARAGCYPSPEGAGTRSSPGEESSMGVATTAISAAVLAAIGLIITWLGKGQFDSMRRELEAMRQEFGARSDAMRQEFGARSDAMRQEFGAGFESIDHRFDAVDQRIDRLGERLDRRMDATQTTIDAMRSDLTQVALAVGVQPRATNA